MVLFFTRGIFLKQDSYVRKEYKMARQFFDKKVYVILLDDIKNTDVPVDMVPWWIDVRERQCLDISGDNDNDKIVR